MNLVFLSSHRSEDQLGIDKWACRAGMRRAWLEGRQIGQPALDLDREAIVRDRRHGDSLGTIARNHGVSRTTVHRVLSENASELVA